MNRCANDNTDDQTSGIDDNHHGRLKISFSAVRRLPMRWSRRDRNHLKWHCRAMKTNDRQKEGEKESRIYIHVYTHIYIYIYLKY